MAGQSKLHFCSDSVEYNCYEIGHTWSSNCPLAIYMFTVPIVKHAFKIYAIFYLVNIIFCVYNYLVSHNVAYMISNFPNLTCNLSLNSLILL